MKAVSFFTALILCVALALTAIYTVAVSSGIYMQNQENLNVAERNGFSQEELRALDIHVAEYLRHGGELDAEYFTLRERLHMEDVLYLVRLCAIVMVSAWILAACGVAVLGVKLKWGAPSALLRGALWALISVCALAAFVAICAVIDFSGVFVIFHKLLFTNDMWLLSASSTLIRMFPEDFFRAMAIEIGVRFGWMLLAFVIVGKGLGHYADTRR